MSIRMVPSCLDVMSSSPSRVWLMKRSARVILDAHFPIDELLQRYVHPVAAGVPLVELHFLDRRHGAGNPVVGLLQRGKVRRKDAAAMNVAEDILAAQRGDPAVIREPGGYRPPSSWSYIATG